MVLQERRLAAEVPRLGDGTVGGRRAVPALSTAPVRVGAADAERLPCATEHLARAGMRTFVATMTLAGIAYRRSRRRPGRARRRLARAAVAGTLLTPGSTPQARGRLEEKLGGTPTSRQVLAVNHQTDTCANHTRWEVPQDYDYAVPTSEAYIHSGYLADGGQGTSLTSTYDLRRHGEVYGEFATIRRKLDYSWHTNYSPQRQAWQDDEVRRVVRSHAQQEQPWVVFTCGPMAAGKGRVMSWLCRHHDFPFEDMVRIDPDQFKADMPEWDGYVRHDTEKAGTMCHKESGLIQELAQEVAFSGGHNIWIDGSLGDCNWYSSLFREVRRRFPQYRIAIIYVHCSEAKVLERAERRGRQTGRFVPPQLLRQSIEMTRHSIDILGPQADFVAMVNNESDTPWLEDFGSYRRQARPARKAKTLPAGRPLRVASRSVLQTLADFVAEINSELGNRWIEVCSRGVCRR